MEFMSEIFKLFVVLGILATLGINVIGVLWPVLSVLLLILIFGGILKVISEFLQ